MILRYDQGMNTHPEPIDHNHPAVEAARKALASDDENGCMIEQHEGNGMWTCLAHGVSADGPEMCWYVRDMPVIALNAALPDLDAATPENLARLRNTPVGRALMAEGWRAALVQLEALAQTYNEKGDHLMAGDLLFAHERIARHNPYREGDA